MPSGNTDLLSLGAFKALMRDYATDPARKITQVHVHHTWRPDHRTFERQVQRTGSREAAGRALVEAMHRYHTETFNWSDIAQHLTIDPAGGLWTGRAWHRPPASARGHNGDSESGPFMFEMIGNFDDGMDPFGGIQAEMAFAVTRIVRDLFRLPPEAIRFHNQMTDLKSCPGTAIDRDDFLAGVDAVGSVRAASARSLGGIGLDAVAADGIDSRGGDGGDELPEELSTADQLEGSGIDGVRGGGGDGFDLTDAVRQNLEGHVINMKAGRFSSDGLYSTLPADVDDYVDRRLKAFIDRQIGQGVRPRVMIYAHGGVTSERNGLALANRQVPTWKANGVYPFFFVWETGVFEAYVQLMRRVFREEEEARGLGDWFKERFRDLRDGVVETLASGIVKGAWDSMKTSAERASESDPADVTSDGPGAATYLARKLVALFQSYDDDRLKALVPDDVTRREEREGLRPELHLVGHSAGAILMNHFTAMLAPKLREAGLQVASLQYLAPACTIAHYREHLAPLVEPVGSRPVTYFRIFNLTEAAERDDTVGGFYEGSILYLVRNALEKRNAPLLGLQESLRRDGSLQRALSAAGHDILYAPNPAAASPDVRTSSRTHSFDQDTDTLNALLCRVLGTVQLPPNPFRQPARAERRAIAGDTLFTDPAPELERALDEFERLKRRRAPLAERERETAWPASGCTVAQTGPVHLSGRTRALCMGINAYQNAPLSGCVKDMMTWRATLSDTLGFDQVDQASDADLGRTGLEETIRTAIAAVRPGDIFVMHYSGHGTHRPARGDDEVDMQDEGLVPQDAHESDMLWDNDLKTLYDQLPPGAHAFVFMDCCHSGSNARLGVGGENLQAGHGQTDRRPRFYDLTRFQTPASLLLKARSRAAARPHVDSGTEDMRHVQFSACQDHEYAWESGGQGDFTRIVTGFLRENPTGISNYEAQLEIERRMRRAGYRRQTPILYCPTELKSLPFLTTLLARARGAR